MGPSRTSVSRDDKAEGGGGGVGRLVEWVVSPKVARYIAGSLTGAYDERQSVFSLFFPGKRSLTAHGYGETALPTAAEALGATVAGGNLLCSHRCTDASMKVPKLAGLAPQEGLARSLRVIKGWGREGRKSAAKGGMVVTDR